VKSSKFLIEHQCPQCGAPATLEETDHLFICGYCRVKSFLQSRDFFRYVLPHRAPKGKSLVYLPYWRFKGCLFSCVSGGIRQKIVDVSHQGVESRYFPISLGLRGQTLKLRFMSPEEEGRFLKPGLAYGEVLELLERRLSASLPKPLFAQAFIGETLSQIYSPFYIEDTLYDAVLNRPVSSAPAEDLNGDALPGGRPTWHGKSSFCPPCARTAAGTWTASGIPWPSTARTAIPSGWQGRRASQRLGSVLCRRTARGSCTCPSTD